jgi:CRP/FNR family transcriptional activator FtrB
MTIASQEIRRTRLPVTRLPPGLVDHLGLYARAENVATKTLLLREGETADSLFILVEGLVQLFTSYHGNNTILILKPVTCFITCAALCGEVLPVSARTIGPAKVYRLAAGDARHLVETDANFAQFVLKDLAGAQSALMQELTSIRTKTALQRLVAWIIAMRGKTKTSSVLELPYDKSLLAARLGMAPETLSRNLAQLAKLGVAIRGRRLQIKNFERLRQIAKSTNIGAATFP